MLTWVSIYWFSASGPAASLNVYNEMVQVSGRAPEKTAIPQGYSYFPREGINAPRSWVHYFIFSSPSRLWNIERSDLKFRWTRAPNLVYEAEHESGGHFAAYHQPQELVNDLRLMFGKKGSMFGIVAGKTGYWFWGFLKCLICLGKFASCRSFFSYM